MNKRIQILRGIAIVAVVMIHTCAKGMLGVMIRPLLNFSVALFIFLSGYLTSIKKSNNYNTRKRRIKKVLIPYIIWSIIYTVATGKYKEFIFNILTGRCCGIYYFIFVYIQFVILTPLIIKLLESKYKILGFLITPLTFICVRYPLEIMGISFPLEILFISWFIYYYLGLIYGNKLIDIKISQVKLYVIFFFLLFLQSIEGLVWNSYGNHNMATSQLKLTNCFSSTFFCIICVRYIQNSDYIKENLINNTMFFLGNVSFGIYLSHILVIMVCNKLDFIGIMDIFPLNSLLIIIITVFCILIGKKILKQYSKYLGL